MRILVLSCDKYADLFEPFYYCMEKYWPNHPEIIYSTESIVNPHYKTICKNYPNNEWTRRIYDTIKDWDDEYIITLCDDVFIRKPVNNDRLNYLYDVVKKLDNFCSLTFISERRNHPNINIKELSDYKNVGIKTRDTWKNSVNATIWNRKNLLKALTGTKNKHTDIWKFESDPDRFYDFNYYSSINGDWPINWGREFGGSHIALQKGKWTRECVDFFNSENYEIDFSKRGIIKGDLYTDIKLSVIIPTYNRSNKILKAINSIPVRDDIEIVVVDDCSTDDTIDVLNSCDRNLVIIKRNNNAGPGRCRNMAMDVAKGYYVTFLDSDDWLITDNVSKVLDNLDYNYDILWFDNKTSTGEKWYGCINKIVFQGSIVKRSLIGSTRQTDDRWQEDMKFTKEIKAKKHNDISYDYGIYVYDYRPNSSDTLTYKHHHK